MELQHVNVKLFVEGAMPVEPSRFINLFHQWIQEHTLPEMLIDVADYCHVPAGPGVLLVAHEADYGMDNAGNRWGVRYNRKAALTGSNVDRFVQAFRAALHAAGLIEKAFAAEGLKFSRNEFELFINDRALAPNTPESIGAFKKDVESFVSTILKQPPTVMELPQDSRRLVGATVRLSSAFSM